MIRSVKCDLCAAIQVCKFKEAYERSVKIVSETMLPSEENGHYKSLKDNLLIEATIGCPYILPWMEDSK